MKLSRSFHGLLLCSCILLALSGTGFASWCFMGNERNTEISPSLVVTDLSNEGNVHLRSDTDPFFLYDKRTFDLIKNHDSSTIKNKDHYVHFLYSPNDPVKYTLVSDIDKDGKPQTTTVVSSNTYSFHEEVWIPKKSIDVNGTPVSLADLIELDPESKRKDPSGKTSYFTLATEDSECYQTDYKVYTLDFGPVKADYYKSGSDTSIEENGKSVRFSISHTFKFSEKYAFRDYTSITGPNTIDESKVPLALDQQMFDAFVQLLNEPDNQILFRVRGETHNYLTWDPKE